MFNLSTINAELATYDRYYWQWWDAKRGGGSWITPTDWLSHGGFPTEAECLASIEAERERVKGIRVRMVRRTVSQVEIPC